MRKIKPLADKLRPERIEDVIGQSHIVGEGKVLRNMVENGRIQNMIFYGPPGVGKTTVANIIAKVTNRRFYKINATNAGVKDIQNIISELDSFLNINGAVLYLDEIQNFNKKQQQALLEFIETGKLILIASTTENPYHAVYNAIVSRCLVYEFKPLTSEEIKLGVRRAFKEVEDEYGIKVEYDEDILEFIAYFAGGDLRRSYNAVEAIAFSGSMRKGSTIEASLDKVSELLGVKPLNFDRDGDNHYDVLSAFQKSIRGSDPDAAVHYLARLLKGGDLQSVCRRLLVIASEDIGLAHPNAITNVKACVDSALMVGLPEARIILSQATIMLATAPKSNTACSAIAGALSDLENIDVGSVPLHLKDAHYKGAKELGRGVEYKYPHAYENNYVPQQYLPNEIKNKRYYMYGDNKMESLSAQYWERIKGGK